MRKSQPPLGVLPPSLYIIIKELRIRGYSWYPACLGISYLSLQGAGIIGELPYSLTISVGSSNLNSGPPIFGRPTQSNLPIPEALTMYWVMLSVDMLVNEAESRKDCPSGVVASERVSCEVFRFLGSKDYKSHMCPRFLLSGTFCLDCPQGTKPCMSLFKKFSLILPSKHRWPWGFLPLIMKRASWKSSSFDIHFLRLCCRIIGHSLLLNKEWEVMCLEMGKSVNINVFINFHYPWCEMVKEEEGQWGQSGTRTPSEPRSSNNLCAFSMVLDKGHRNLDFILRIRKM